ncbi:arginase family protein [Hyalangium versicolor]|uniref:arginase family protein n=1 Tax=Hyalangium versicolor TaxID=2861190 RepID=UPI001CCA898B|nr:arginase family protein [Hyalangium versicolor]
MLDLIEAPNNLGLRPLTPGVEPGTWRAPAALDHAGLSRQLHPDRHLRLPRPEYSPKPQPGTRLRNGPALRDFNLRLSAEVEQSLRRGAVPVVVGGDCSILLGCLHALRKTGGRGMVHLDGHSDFAHPGNFAPHLNLWSAAGMALALATGRGESLLTEWPGVEGPLLADADAVHLGERESLDADYTFQDIEQTAIEQITVHAFQKEGVAQIADRILRRLIDRKLDRAWLHVDLDILDQKVMPAVDSPGSPGLTYAELTTLLRTLLASRRIAGLNIAIYDPDLDPHGTHASNIVACVASGLEVLHGAAR